MARLIDADELFKKLENTLWNDNADRDIAEDLLLDATTIDPESLHRERTVATNADCIRSMSDERLADQLVIDVNGLESRRLYLSPITGKLYRIRTEAVKEVKEWLRQPTEED